MGCCDTKMPRCQAQMTKIYSNSTYQQSSQMPTSMIEKRDEKARKITSSSEFSKPTIELFPSSKDSKQTAYSINYKNSGKMSANKYNLPSSQIPTIPIHLNDIEFVNNSDIHIEIEQEPDHTTKASDSIIHRRKLEKQNDIFSTKTNSSERQNQELKLRYNERIDTKLRGVHIERGPQKLTDFGDNELNLRQTFVPIKCYSDDIGFKQKRYEAGLSVISEVISGAGDTDNYKRSSIIVSDENEKEKKFSSADLEGKNKHRTTFGPKPKKCQNLAPKILKQSSVYL